MTYDQLLTLDAIVKEGSFKAAAAFLNKSQPALSVAIRKLEEEFQIKLFSREAYRPVLTDEGEMFYEKAQLALHHMQTLQYFGEELALGTEAEVNVGIDGVVPLSLVMCNLRDFFDEYTSSNLNLSIDYLSGTWEKLINKELDICFAPMFQKSEDVEAHAITESRMVSVCRPDFLLEDQRGLSSFKKAPQVVIADSGSGDLSVGVLKGGRRWTVPDSNTKREIIFAGLGWGQLPHHMVEEDLVSGSLVELKNLGIERPSFPIYMVRHRQKPMGPITKKLWQKFKEIFEVTTT